MSKIKNINGTSTNKCTCGSWLQHWKNFSNQSVTYCSESNCINKDLVGAHVQKSSLTDNSWYIIPLCKAHNNSSEELEVLSDIKFVSANKSLTCEK
jgi:hypothetical protein